MASFATTTEAGDGSNLVFDVKFEFISRVDVDVYRLSEGEIATDPGTKLSLIDSGVPAGDQYIWLNNERIQVGTAPTSVEQIKIQRTTDFTQQTVQWQDGSFIIAQDLNTSEEQNLFVDQELADWLSNITGGGKGPDDLVEIEDIGDIHLDNPQKWDLITYDDGTQKWVNKSPSEIAENAIDLEDLKDVDDFITEKEMERGVTEDRWVDGAISTAGAAKRFFQPIQSAVQPDIGPIEKGRFWYQEYKTGDNKEVQSFNIWTANGWRNISSGQVIPNPFTPDSVIYVDPQGNDNNPGRKPDEAYRTIHAAVEEANSRVPSTVSNIESAIYDNTSGFINFKTTAPHDLIAGYTITLTPITWECQVIVEGVPVTGTKQYPPLPKEFRVSSIVGPSEFRVYVSPTPKVHTYISGGTVTPLDVRIGDGYTIQCAPGVYHEKLPIRIEAKNLSILGTSLRNTYIHPDIYTSVSSSGGSGIPPYESPDRALMSPVGTQDGVSIYDQELQIIFEMDSGSYLTGFTLCGLKSLGARGSGGIDPDATYGLPPRQGWVSAHRNAPDKAFITKSPYIQNCTHFSDLQTNNADFDINFLAGEGGDTTSGPAGGGILVDGERVNPSSPLRSYVVDSFTQISLGGPGVLATNNGYAQLVSFFGTFCWYHAKSLNGGQLNLSNCTSDFGQYALIASGKSPSSIFNAALTVDRPKGSQFIQVDSFTRGTGWSVPRTMTPVDNMVIDVGGTLYPILSSRKNATGYEINIFSPASDKSATKVPSKSTNVVNAVYDNVSGFVTIETDKPHTLLAGRTVFVTPMVWSCPAPDVGSDSFPRTETEYKVQDVTGSTTFIIYVGPNDKPHNYTSGGIVIPTDINPDTFSNGGLIDAVLQGSTVRFYLQSYISTGGHTMEFVGSGTDYRAHPDFGGVPKPENQTVEIGGAGDPGSRLSYLNGGRIWLSSTDENGNFKVGETFVVNQKTGSIYILPEAVKNTFVLKDDLDLRGYKIWVDPATGGVDGDLQLQPAGQGGIILGTDSYDADGNRENPAAIREPILERGLDDNRKWPVVSQRDLGYDADEVPVSGLLGQLAFTDSAPAVTATTSAPLPNEIKFSVSGNELTITYQPADGTAAKSTKLTLS
jgi:hypothetical protein